MPIEPADLGVKPYQVDDDEDPDIPVIGIDDGSGYMKVGPCGEDSPAAILRDDFPGRNGIVEDWDRRADQWEMLYRDGLNGLNPRSGGNTSGRGGPVDLTEHSVSMVRPALDPSDASLKTCEIHFERFGVQGLAVMPSHLMSMYASGRGTGLCVCAGHSTTTVGAVVEGSEVGQPRREAFGASDVFRMMGELNGGEVDSQESAS